MYFNGPQSKHTQTFDLYTCVRTQSVLAHVPDASPPADGCRETHSELGERAQACPVDG